MNNEEEFKEHLQKLVESKEFTFDESEWEKASALLHPKSGRRLIYYMAAALLLLISGIASYFYFITYDKTTTQVTIVPTSHLPSKAEKLSSIKSSSENNTRSHTIINPSVKLHEEPASQPKQAAGSLTEPAVIKEPVSSSKQQSTTKYSETIAATKNNFTKPEKINHRNQAFDPSSGQSPLTAKDETHVSPSISKITEVNPVPAKNYSDKHSKTKALSSDASANTVSSEEVNQTPSTINKSEKENSKASIDSKDTAKQNEKNTKETAIPETQTLVTSADLTIPTVAPSGAETTSALKNTQAEQQPSLSATPESLIAKTDSAAKMQSTETPMPSHKKMIMNFDAGLDYLAGWKNPGGKDANGFNPVIGFNYYNYLTDKLAVSLGAQYTTVSHLNAYSHVSKITQYDLGEESAVTVITPQKIHYFMVPIKLNYSLNEKNTIGIGCNIAYLLNVSSKMETYDESFGRRLNDKVYKTSGYTDGFAAFDTQLSVFYRRKIYKNLSASAEAFYGLTDIKTNGFFNSNTSQHNMGLKLTIHYCLFK